HAEVWLRSVSPTAEFQNDSVDSEENLMVPRKYIEKLRMELAGRVLEAGDPGYDQSLVIDNGRIDLRPGIVVMCVNPDDVATAYKFAIEHDMPFTVRGGGHSAAGYCLNQGGM